MKLRRLRKEESLRKSLRTSLRTSKRKRKRRNLNPRKQKLKL